MPFACLCLKFESNLLEFYILANFGLLKATCVVHSLQYSASFWQFPYKMHLVVFILANLQPHVIEHAQNIAKWPNLFWRLHN